MLIETNALRWPPVGSLQLRSSSFAALQPVEHNKKILRVRFRQFLAGDYETSIKAWRLDYDKSLARDRQTKVVSAEERKKEATKLVQKGFISRAVNLINSFGVAPRTEKVTEQMRYKHPQTADHSWEAPTVPDDVSVNIEGLDRIVKRQDPLTGTGPRGFRPDFAAAFFKGTFDDNEAIETPFLFEGLGVLYLSAKMPPWMRLKLGGGALTPISKE